MDDRNLIYDWNERDVPAQPRRIVDLDDETLRDGLQSASVSDPPIEAKLELVHLMVSLGIRSADIGLPGAGQSTFESALAIAREIATHNLPINANCAARTVTADIEPIATVSQKAGIPVEASLFIGSSPVRRLVEKWEVDHMVRMVEKAVRFAVGHDLPVMFVTEDSTRSDPMVLRALYLAAIECGARRICLADTVGHATPDGTRSLVRWARELVRESGEDVKIDWHGHNDRGMALINAMVALETGVDRVHGTALGTGERSGNTPMELILINLRMLGVIDNDLSRLSEYCELVSRTYCIPMAYNHPVVGADAFRTSTGVHASAVLKATRIGKSWLADRVYSSVPAAWVGRSQVIEIGPMSGASNVIHWLETRGYEARPDAVTAILDAAKQSRRLLSEDEILGILQGCPH
jgi:2-isopropylmalate synthase